MSDDIEIKEWEAKDENDDEIEIDESLSEIIQFYEGSNIFVTGATGFLGHLLLEKLLRTCSKISRIYLLVRPKRGISSEERIEKFFNGVVFEKMRSKYPNFFEKITLITGDCEEPDLGLSEADKHTLIENVNVVFHVAATVKFNEKIRKATNINVRGTRDITILCQQMKNLKAFVYTSTAYSNCILPEIDEMFYDNVEMTGDKLIEIVNSLDDDKLDILTPTLIGERPNTYTYTKAIAENVVRQYGKDLPVVIIRPSIVTSTYKEPLFGWTNNLFGPVGMAVAIALGIMRAMYINLDYNLDIVPADYCINAIITSAWVVGKNKQNNVSNVVFDELKMEDNIPILNYTGASQKPLTNRQFKALCELYGPKIPSEKCVWKYCSWSKLNKYKYYLYVLFLHYLPGLLVDTVLVIQGKGPMMIKAYKKIHKFCDANSYFNIREWTFHNHNTQTIWKKLNPTDKRLFEFDMGMLSWEKYAKSMAYGARVYLLRDPIETVPQGKSKHKKLKILHYTVIALYYSFLISIVWMLDCSPLMLCCLVALYKMIV